MRIRRRGSSLVESTFALGAMLFIMVGAVQAGRYLFAQQLLPHIAREGARFALLHPEGDVRAHVADLIVGVPAREIVIRTQRERGSVIVETEWMFSAGIPVRGRAVIPAKRSADTPAPAGL